MHMDVFNINGSQQLPIFCKANLFLISGGGVYISGVMEDLKVWAEDERTDTGNKEQQLGCLLHVTNGSSISVFILLRGSWIISALCENNCLPMFHVCANLWRGKTLKSGNRNMGAFDEDACIGRRMYKYESVQFSITEIVQHFFLCHL